MNNNKKIILQWNQKHVLKESTTSNGIGLYGASQVAVAASKIANEQYRINKILEAYPTPQDLSRELRSTENAEGLELADKLDSIGNDPKAYYNIVRKLSGRTFCHWLGNLIGGPFALIYQAINLSKNYGGKLSGRQVVYDRV